MDLFGGSDDQKLTDIGKAEVIYSKASSILTEAKGFMGGYDYTLNPYSGCTFGCTYCYAAFFARFESDMKNWGKWVRVKENAIDLLNKFSKKNVLKGKTIYMSSVTDPYQPVEKKLELTRSLLKLLLPYQPTLVIQTRSPNVVRDIDIFQQFEHIQVNMTITTDSEIVRKTFEPFCPSNKVRLDAIKNVHEAGVPSCITMTPLLPIDNAEIFAKQLLQTGIRKFVVQPFHAEKGKFIAGTREQALNLIKEFDWTDERYKEILRILEKYIPNIGIGKDGFQPPL